MKLQVQYIKAGDVLSGTEEIVLNSPYSTVRTPSDKLNLIIGKEGIKRHVVWGKYTMVNIKDKIIVDSKNELK